MTSYALITGGGTGLGQAIAKKLADKNMTVFIAGRRLKKLQETQSYNPNNIIPIKADVSSPQGRNIIFNTLQKTPLHFLIHNAAIVTPILPLEKVTLTHFKKIMATNLEGPIFLTQLLLPLLQKNSRILHISSDCARFPLAHWIPYCTSKAALFMAYECLKKELAPKKIFMGSIDPGMMDTPMQRYICQDTIQFPEKYSIQELKEDNLLLSPDFSADICLKLLLHFSPSEFSQKDYCAYDFK